MSPILLHNTLTRQIDPLQISGDRVTMYVCGPTVYNFAHIGNARPYVLFGLLARLLRRRYGQVIYARNLTDVDDRINAAASAQQVAIDVITNKFADAFRADMLAIGADQPDLEPRATEHIPQILSMCARLIQAGHAYEAEGHVLFDVASYPDYGHLSRRSLREMIAGARVDVAPYKRNPADFVLWKPSSGDLPGWDSAYGRGRPGWHIECSAMSEALGDTLDIHAGGNDLMFPHHENEIAQSTCAHGGTLFAKHWLHNGFVTVEGRKMSKSIGNVLLINDLRKRYAPEVLRYVLLSAHYRQPMDWSERALEQAKSTLDRLYASLRDMADVTPEAATADEIEAALCEDLNTPRALAELNRLSREAQKATGSARPLAKGRLLDAAQWLGLLAEPVDSWFGTETSGDPLSAQVEDLLVQRTAARAGRDFARADEIRAELTALGVVIDDTPAGPRWSRG